MLTLSKMCNISILEIHCLSFQKINEAIEIVLIARHFNYNVIIIVIQ